ncbi:hypothetical protein HK101_009448 [Irineochytrium annulatum]|nr:hypothetical protein HK101_009448 [Irineochytrium annulatum]
MPTPLPQPSPDAEANHPAVQNPATLVAYTTLNPFLSARSIYAKKYTPTEVWWNDARAWCYAFSGDYGRITTTNADGSVITNKVLIPTYADGRSAGAPIFNLLPNSKGYSDAFTGVVVTVPDWVKKDKYRDFGILLGKGWPTSNIGVFNFPMVSKGSELLDYSSPPNVVMGATEACGHVVHFFDFGMINGEATASSVPAGKAYFTTYKGDSAGYPVVDAVHGDAAYTGFYAEQTVTLSSGVVNQTFRSVSQLGPLAASAKASNVYMNCPTLFVESSLYAGNFPDHPPAPIWKFSGTPAGQTVAPISAAPTDASVYWNGPPATYTDAPAFYKNQSALCWSFGNHSTVAADESTVVVNSVLVPVYITPNPDGSKRSAGNPVVNLIPTDKGYSDAVAIEYVYVPDMTAQNQFTNYATLTAAAQGSPVFGGVKNMPIVPLGSQIVVDGFYMSARNKTNIPALLGAWYKGHAINFFDAGLIAAASDPTKVPTNKAVAAGNVPVLSTISSDAAYTGFYSVGTANGTSQDFGSYNVSAISFTGGVFNCPTAAMI